MDIQPKVYSKKAYHLTLNSYQHKPHQHKHTQTLQSPTRWTKQRSKRTTQGIQQEQHQKGLEGSINNDNTVETGNTVDTQKTPPAIDTTTVDTSSFRTTSFGRNDSIDTTPFNTPPSIFPQWKLKPFAPRVEQTRAIAKTPQTGNHFEDMINNTNKLIQNFKQTQNTK